MGLAGRKQKQRIGHDPRNLSWADDASRFGQNYLAKFGWDASKGLGAQGEGRTSAIKVSQKLDMMGIGAAHTKDPNGIAWKQSKDYENLLARLNAAAAGEAYAPATGVVAEGGFVKPTEGESGGENANTADGQENAGEGKEKTKEELKREKEKKRKRKEQEGEGEDGEKKSKKRKKEKSEDSTPAPAAEESSDDEPLPAPAPRPVLRRAHRSRHIAFKSMATKDAAAVAEILGVAPTPSSLSSTASPMGALTPISDEPATMEKLMKSTKSVADYFKERLAAKATAKSGSSTPVPPSGTESAAEESTSREESEAPRGGLGSSQRRDQEEDAPRVGLGSRSGLGSGSGLGFGGGLGFGARPHDEDESAPRGGLGSFARMFQMPSTAPTTETGKGMAMFAALSSSKVLSGEATPANGAKSTLAEDISAPVTETEKERRKREKKEKKRMAEEAQESEEKATKKEKRMKSEADDEVAPGDAVEESRRKEKKKDKKGKAKQGNTDEATAEAVDDGRKESKKRKRDKQSEDDLTPSTAPTPSNDSETTLVEDAKTREERKAEKRRRKEEKKRKEA